MGHETTYTDQQWALGDDSIDFSQLSESILNDKENNKSSHQQQHPSGSMAKQQQQLEDLLNGCSHTDADTISTAGESSSCWSSSLYDHNMNGQSLEYNPSAAHASAILARQNTDESESSLTLDDIKQFFLEDQVGIFNPARDEYDLPAPKGRTVFKGDSQHSFTLQDLEMDDEEGDENAKEEGNDSLGDLLAPSSATRRRSSRRRRSSAQRKEQIQGILKNGPCNTRRSSSLTMLMMEDSDLFHLSMGFEDSDEDENGVDENGISGEEAKDNQWGLMGMMMDESFDAEATLDLQVLQEKQVRFCSVVVHEHGVVVGDNPSVGEGVPLMLGWKAESSTTYESLDEYEEQRKPPATSVKKLGTEERMARLTSAGATQEEMQQAEAQVRQTRFEREATRQRILLGSNNSAALFWKAIQKSELEQEGEKLHHLPKGSGSRRKFEDYMREQERLRQIAKEQKEKKRERWEQFKRDEAFVMDAMNRELEKEVARLQKKRQKQVAEKRKQRLLGVLAKVTGRG